MIAYWCEQHPRCGRAVALLGVLQILFCAAVGLAPTASASTNGMVLNWTGLRDSYGVPIGDYYLSIASTSEQVTVAGPDVGLNPVSWMQWTMHAMTVFASHLTVATILTGEAGAFIGMVALALWVMKITVSTYWLTVIGEIARAITGAVIQVTTQLGLLLIAIPVGVFAGAVTVRRGEAGRGATMILLAVTVPALSVAIFSDPAGEMYGPDGLLAFGRRVGFSVAEAAVHNGEVGSGGYTGQVDSLTASLITHAVREPLQLWNFGHVVDKVAGCGPAWSAAVRVGLPDGPLHAMGACGDRAAMAYAQHLDGSNTWVGFVLVGVAVVLGWFMVVSGWAVLQVSVKAIWTTVIVLPSLWLGAIPGAPQRRAIEVVWQFFRHGIEVLIYIVYISVIGLAIERLVSAPLPAQLGGTNPFAHVLMMGAASIAAFVLLHHIRTDLSGHRPGRGVLARATGVAVGMGITATVGAAGSATVKGAKGLARLGGSTDPPRWERLGAAPSGMHGQPQPGFNPIPDGGSGGSGGGNGAPAGGRGVAGRPGAPTGGVTTVASDLAGHRQPVRAGAQSDFGGEPGGPAGSSGGVAPSVPPMTEWVESTHDSDVLIPNESPDDDTAPPSQEGGPAPPAPTTVDPIAEKTEAD